MEPVQGLFSFHLAALGLRGVYAVPFALSSQGGCADLIINRDTHSLRTTTAPPSSWQHSTLLVKGSQPGSTAVGYLLCCLQLLPACIRFDLPIVPLGTAACEKKSFYAAKQHALTDTNCKRGRMRVLWFILSMLLFYPLKLFLDLFHLSLTRFRFYRFFFFNFKLFFSKGLFLSFMCFIDYFWSMAAGNEKEMG